jgi:pterin-4a-carbinolamine dehydratase
MPGFYFLNESLRGPAASMDTPTSVAKLPIHIEKRTWEHLQNPRRIAKIYKFDDKGQQAYFVADVMNQIGTQDHRVKISIDRNMVQIETYTEYLEDVSEIDLEIARSCDEMFEDAMFVVVQQ